jgi:histidinol-phosphatase (PHP family)
MLIDHHLHYLQKNEDKSIDTLRKYLKEGKKKNIQYFGFSEHAYLFREAHNINFNNRQNQENEYQLKDYINILEKLKEENNNVLMGLEVDYAASKEYEIRNFIRECKTEYGIDYFIGSVHWIGGWGVDLDQSIYNQKMDEIGVKQAYREYFNLIKQVIRSKLFNIIGHIDLIKIFGAKARGKAIILEVIEILKKHKQVIEVNTNGLEMEVKELYPSKFFLKECFKKKIPITLSSDAHKAGDVGRKFEEAIKIIKSIGYDRLVYFQKGEQKFIKI